MMQYYIELFRADILYIHPDCFQNQKNIITKDRAHQLKSTFTKEQVLNAMKNLKSNTALGRVGF